MAWTHLRHENPALARRYQATEVGRRLTIKEALDLARIPETAAV
jgi:hypothetical protein